MSKANLFWTVVLIALVIVGRLGAMYRANPWRKRKGSAH